MGTVIRSHIRPVAITVGALLTAVVLWVTSALAMAVALAATALIVPGTGTPDPTVVGGYLDNARKYYIQPFNSTCDGTCDLVGIKYPAQFWPIPLPGWGGLSGAKWNVSTGEGITNLNSTLIDTLTDVPADDKVIIFGYSQGGNIVTREKSLLKNLDTTTKNQLSFVVIGDTNRPNGGLFERLAFLGTVPILDATFGLPAPTDTGIATTDIAFQYDGVADFPLYPLNLLADLNAIAGFWYVHGTYLAPDAKSDPGELPDDYTPEELADQLDSTKHPENFSNYGDTTYVTIPTRTLPIVRPLLEFAGFTGTTFLIKPLVDLVAPALRVLIDTGYDRTLPYGVPAPFRLIPLVDPIKLITDLVAAVGQGVDAFATDVFSPHTNSTTQTPATTQNTSIAPAVTAARVAGTAGEQQADAKVAPATAGEDQKSITEPESAPATDTGTQTSTAATTPATDHTTDVTADETKTEDTKTADTKSGDATTEDTKTEDTTADDTTTEDTTADDTTTEQTATEDTTSEDAKSGETASSDDKTAAKTSDTKTEDTKTSDSSSSAGKTSESGTDHQAAAA